MDLKNLRRKLNSRKGESIAEVLVALLVSALGIVLLASMIASSVRMIEQSRETVNDYVVEQNKLADGTAPANAPEGTVTLTNEAGRDQELTDATKNSGTTVVYYKNEEIGGKPVTGFRKKGD